MGEKSVPEQTNGTSNGKEETETVEGDETVAKSKVLNVAPPEEVPENFSEYLSDSTNTAEEGGDRSAAAVPTSVIQSVPKVDTEKEEAENLEEKAESDNNLASEVTEAADLLQEETPKEASCTVADLIDETEEEENSKEEKEEETPLEEEKKEEIVEEKVEE